MRLAIFSDVHANIEALSAVAADCRYDATARSLLLGRNHPPLNCGTVGVIAAGTSDAPVVAEAVAVLEFLGIETVALVDKGVAGVHRLMSSLPELKDVGAWHEGVPRGPADVGRAGEEISTRDWTPKRPLD